MEDAVTIDEAKAATGAASVRHYLLDHGLEDAWVFDFTNNKRVVCRGVGLQLVEAVACVVRDSL